MSKNDQQYKMEDCNQHKSDIIKLKAQFNTHEVDVRNVISDQIQPLYNVAKKNMITNMEKNAELITAKEKIDGILSKIQEFKIELYVLKDFE